MTMGYHPLVKRLLDGELSRAELASAGGRDGNRRQIRQTQAGPFPTGERGDRAREVRDQRVTRVPNAR